MSRQVDQLKLQNEFQQQEIGKLRLIKERLADLCRELQKSNNQIRIESLALIKGEQHKAKEQADKIQTTLAGVMKLFDENQQRNLSLKQENIDLQTKLKQLLEHCENWEQCVETAIKQRDIENRLVKTELTRLSLIRTEEQERFLKEKHDLLKALELMKTHQSRVEDKEAKLRSDLSSYANKYDQCQELIQNGLGKFQVESKRMLKQIEQSRQDYVALLNKYEASNKKIKQLLEEKHAWMKSTVQTSKKLETLEKLCRSLKSENDRLVRESSGSNNNNNRGAGGSLVETTTTGVGSSSIEPQEITCKGPNTTSVITTTPTTGQPDESPTGESLGQRVPLVIITNDQSQV
uniref:Alpha-taxilin n=1 Tax=Aceria tosichella TaxID=561515 RepID=A0A6G1SCG2_9ACAR